MISRSTRVHLRLPFSFFLLPVFLFALSVGGTVSPLRTFIIFFILHFLVYPASNGYNSYYDKDDNSIGGLQNPPEVSRELYSTSLILDFIAVVLSMFISLSFAMMIFIYGLVSKAYSHPVIRLKKYPVIGWLTIGIFQGFFIFMASVKGLTDYPFSTLLTPQFLVPAILSSLLLLGSYPMTQIYQHEEDEKRGDITLSLRLGILGTFHFTSLIFTLAVAGFAVFYINYYDIFHVLIFVLVMLPVVIYFVWWYLKVRKSRRKADFTHTMRLNFISALCLNIFFLGVRLFS